MTALEINARNEALLDAAKVCYAYADEADDHNNKDGHDAALVIARRIEGLIEPAYPAATPPPGGWPQGTTSGSWLKGEHKGLDTLKNT